MKRSWFEWLVIFLIFAGLALIVVVAIDQGTSSPQAIKHCVVSEKHYEAGHYTYDSDNNATWHPDRWYILVSPTFVEVNVSCDQYEKLRTGRAVDILVRKGGVVGGEYYSIAPNLEE